MIRRFEIISLVEGSRSPSSTFFARGLIGFCVFCPAVPSPPLGKKTAFLSLENRFCGVEESGPGVASEKERDFGIVREIVVLAVLGEGLLLLLPVGLDPGVLSREWRKLELRVRQGSGSSVGIPVAEVVVVHVLVDMRLMSPGGRLLRSL